MKRYRHCSGLLVFFIWWLYVNIQLLTKKSSIRSFGHSIWMIFTLEYLMCNMLFFLQRWPVFCLPLIGYLMRYMGIFFAFFFATIRIFREMSLPTLNQLTKIMSWRKILNQTRTPVELTRFWIRVVFFRPCRKFDTNSFTRRSKISIFYCVEFSLST